MFKKLKTEFEKHDLAREKVIIASRGVIKLSKKIISAVHRDDIKDSEKYVVQIKKELNNMKKLKHLANTGSYSMAVQEYIEAILLLEYVVSGKVLSYDDFDCTPDEFIMGVCDFVGELQRRSVIKASKGDRETIKKISKDVTLIYDGFLDFSFRGQVRKKFDLVKYVMLKLEEIMFELNLKK